MPLIASSRRQRLLVWLVIGAVAVAAVVAVALLLPNTGGKHRRRLLEADDGVRTRDPQLGKLMLYQLSYVRASWKR